MICNVLLSKKQGRNEIQSIIATKYSGGNAPVYTRCVLVGGCRPQAPKRTGAFAPVLLTSVCCYPQGEKNHYRASCWRSRFFRHRISEILRIANEDRQKFRNFRVQSRAVELNTICECLNYVLCIWYNRYCHNRRDLLKLPLRI